MRLHGNFLLKEGKNKTKSFRGIQLYSCSITDVSQRGGVREVGGRSVVKVPGRIIVISRGLTWFSMGERGCGSVKFWGSWDWPAQIVVKKRGRVRLLWTRRKGEGKASTDVYYLLLSACGTGNGESCYGPSSESAQSHLQ